jgi:hypothetical protein
MTQRSRRGTALGQRIAISPEMRLGLQPTRPARRVLLEHVRPMANLLRSRCVLATLSLALVQCGGSAFATDDSPDGGGGATGSTSGASSGTGASGSGGSSGTGESGSSSGASSGASTGSASGVSSGSASGASSGSASGSRSGSSSGGSGASGGSDAGTSDTCPTAAPPAGSACPKDGLECEYGSSPEEACNKVADCTTGAWAYTASTGDSCVTSSCPVTYDRITDGAHCDSAGATCAYPAGTCTCGSSGPLLVSIDGSVGGPTWHCQPATVACPSPRPDIGTPCSGVQSCNYGACAGGIALECTDGIWQQTFTPCPL